MQPTPDKTAWADARVLADLVRVGYLPKVWLAPEDVRQPRPLVRSHQQLAAPIGARHPAELGEKKGPRQGEIGPKGLGTT